MRGYKHLTFHDRLKIEKMRKQGAKQCQIAAAIHVSESTISRELRRGTYEHLTYEYITETRYSPDIAQERYDANKTAKGGPLKIGNDHALATHIEQRIADDRYSPCAVLAEIENNGTLKFSVTICRQTLYNYIDKGVFLRITNKDLPFRGGHKKRKTRHIRPARAPKGDSIEKRPEVINGRAEFGHWEMDTVESNRQGRSCLLVLTERLTRQEIILRQPDQAAASTVRNIDRLEYRYGAIFPSVFKSITIDNGSEFADCAGIERSIFGGSRTKCYYCHPYSAYERGSNEKQNQMIRRHFPKGTNFDLVTDEDVKRVEQWLNTYPRKLLDWGNSDTLFTRAINDLAAC